MKQTTALALFCFLIFVFVCNVARAQPPATVKIGLVYPLTGTMSLFGQDMANALPLLEKRFNAEQKQYVFQLLLEDGKFGQGNAAITAAKKLVDVDGVRFLVVGSSGEVLQIAPFAESAHVLTVAGFSSNPDVRKAGDYIFRTYVDLERGMEVVVHDFAAKGLSRIAVISEEASFCLGNKNSLTKFLGDKIVFAEDFAPGDADFKTLVAKARNTKPQAYYLNVAAPASFIALLRTLRENGVKEPISTYYVPSVKDVQDALGAQLDGVTYLDFPAIADDDKDFRSFLSAFEQKYGEPKAAFNLRTNYNALKVVYDGIVSAGNDPEKVKNFLYRYDRPSATGRLRFDENGDVRDLNLVLTTYKK